MCEKLLIISQNGTLTFYRWGQARVSLSESYLLVVYLQLCWAHPEQDVLLNTVCRQLGPIHLRLHSFETAFVWDRIRLRPHSFETAFVWDRIRLRPHSFETAFVWDRICLRPHSFETTFLWDHIPLRPHSFETTFLGDHIHWRPHLFETTFILHLPKVKLFWFTVSHLYDLPTTSLQETWSFARLCPCKIALILNSRIR